ncbi:apolipoprotein N-acyltransferase [Nocardioides sp. YIM 152315]|uniref:apolipoprotein N-acyltransferase n=1 Tax=Nocardioides sp. YIM 152315 TaxID=3031760 RepID=UPI0023DBF985|nr:apolipoprotein N-acyltransferase [Nocardioides sp. YIM 152315]MDF1602481.1 apolipoprotein N-acyltransferase [Nocardioides sp. YIM 152315]
MLPRILVAALCGVGLSLAFEPVAQPVVIPLCIAGFALCCRGLRLRSGWVPALAFGIGFQWVHLFWMRAVGPDAWLALATVEAVFIALLGSLTTVLVRHRWWPLWVAAGWTTIEVWRSGWPFSGMPWGRLAFATADTFVADSLPWIGSVGVSFVLALSGTLLAWLVVARGRERRLAAGLLAGLVAVSLLPVAVSWQGERSGTAVVAAVQGDVPGDGDDILYDYRQVTQNHVDVTTRLADDVAAGREPAPDFVVWPENSTAIDPFRDQQTNAGILAASDAIGEPILVGAIVDAGPDHVLNQGIVWDPVTGAGDRYTKRHPVPFGEYIPARQFFTRQFGRLAEIPRDMLSGTRSEPLTIAGVRVADSICFDVAYDDGIYAQVSRGAEMLTVQTSNATFIHTDQIDQQFAITRLRAIETGRWLVVASTNGVTGVIAPDGTVVASAEPRTQAALVEQVDLVSSVTPAVRIGPWSGRILAGLTAVGLVLALVPYRRTRARQAAEDTPQPTGVAGGEESRSE